MRILALLKNNNIICAEATLGSTTISPNICSPLPWGTKKHIQNICPTYIGFKRTTLGKAYGTKRLGTNWGTQIGTWWENIKNNKNPTTPFLKKKKEKNWIHWMHVAIFHRLIKPIVHNRVWSLGRVWTSVVQVLKTILVWYKVLPIPGFISNQLDLCICYTATHNELI